MTVIPRSQSGLASPAGAPTGPYEKNVIIIHYTDSPNGLLSVGQEQGLMRMWQSEHESKYGAWDILQAYSCFQSGRVYENRLWTANSGAIYNSGGGQVFGWSSKGVGIENQGDFHGSTVMQEPQYSALVALCADIYKRPGFKPLAGRWIFGHQELPPCRPGDPWGKGTDCPANLLAQFVANGKLQNDVLAYIKHGPVKPKEDDMQSWDYNQVTEARKIDCYRDRADYWVTTDGKTREVVFIFEGKDGSFPATPSDGQEFKTPVQHDHSMSRILQQPKFAGLKGSFKLIIKSADPIDISIREVPK
jgi:hypothetical protein